MATHSPAEPASPRLSTWEDFIALDEDDLRELIDGRLMEVEAPNEEHEHIVATLIVFVGSWARSKKAGHVYASGYKVRVSARRGVMPDVQFYANDNPTERKYQGVESGRSDLAVEVVSPTRGRYDRRTKLEYYASIGVPEYWIVDPTEHTVARLLLRGEHYMIAEVRADDEVFRPDTFEGLEIPLAELWRTPPEPPAEPAEEG